MEDDKEIGRRLVLIRKAKGVKQIEFASVLGLSRPTVSGLENGNHPLSDRNIKTVCFVYNVNEEWLRFGKGDMFNPPSDSPDSENEDEARLLSMFRRLSTDTKLIILDIVKKLMATREAEKEQAEATEPPPAHEQDVKKERKIS